MDVPSLILSLNLLSLPLPISSVGTWIHNRKHARKVFYY